MSQLFIARQPIYNDKLDVHGYELLFRASDSGHAEFTDGEQATSQRLINALMEIGLPRLVGNHPAFINLTERFIIEGLPNAMAPEQVVLEVLEDVLPGSKLLTALQDLKQDGYTIALDDFEYDDSKRPLVALADLIKGERTPSCHILILRLLARIQDPEIEFRELADLIAQDISFSYRILRYINSAQFSYSRKVESIQSAATMIGLQRIKIWLTILVMAQIDDKPYELLLTSLIRARMCETLRKNAGHLDSSAFITGLFSALDALTDQPLESVLSNLPLSDEINQALLVHEGRLGELLALVLAYEAGDWETVEARSIDTAALREAYCRVGRPVEQAAA
ncbi:Predicted signal transduction protein [hydrothermal vent metagenome]|uniref:Predicted signal transduction protein n=1 Tax=hydrothermal vent metagenome TaxID=652676 RepID=A0A3B1AF58_9ZZZZ